MSQYLDTALVAVVGFFADSFNWNLLRHILADSYRLAL